MSAKVRNNETSSQAELARELREAFNAVSPFIEKHTALVCPDCKKVCCIDKHGRYDNNDLVFLQAVGVKVLQRSSDHKETEPCRFLNDNGCSRERWERPFRCTYFFCDRLLKSLENDSAKLYRAFLEYFQYLVSVRHELLEQDLTDT